MKDTNLYTPSSNYLSLLKPLFNFFAKDMPPRKRKASQVLQKQVEAKRKAQEQFHEATSSPPPTGLIQEGHAETAQESAPIADQESTTITTLQTTAAAVQPGHGTVVPPLSSGLQSTISFNAANGESDYDPLPICTFNDLDIFITDSSKQKIWNSEYIDLALLLRQNFCPNTDTVGTLTVVNNQLTVKTGAPKIKVPINSIELWTDAFINFTMVFGVKHQEKIPELLKYMTVIRGAAVNNPIQRWATYDIQFRLRMSRDPSRSWATIDGHLWLSCGLSGDLSATSLTSGPCYEYNFKGFCARLNCGYSHTCIKCKVQHPASNCNLFKETKFQSGNRSLGLPSNSMNINRPLATGFSALQSNVRQNLQSAAPVFSPVQPNTQQNQRHFFLPRQQLGRQFRPARFRFQSRYMGPRANSN